MSAGRISMVVPTYNVARYLPAFLQSLDDQVDGLADVELIFVNDGATDASGEIISAWLVLHPGLDARLVTKENGGLSSARNAGLDAATGEWITFPDPDDVLTPEYLSVMRAFLKTDKAKTIHLVAGNLIYLDDETGKRSNSHPLRFKFAEHHRIVDLERHPEFIHLHGNTALCRRALFEKFGLRFDAKVKPNFEDAHLIGLYLAKFERPRIAMLDDAVYLYRRRSDGSSLVQGSWAKEAKYKDLPQHGWLHMLQTVQSERGRIPRWMQILVLYDMFFYFRMDTRATSVTAGLPADWKKAFLSTLTEVLEFVEPDLIESYKIVRVAPEVRCGVLFGLKHADPQISETFVDYLDQGRQLVRIRYYYSGPLPEEQYRARGFVVRPVFAKSRAVTLFGRVMMHERTAWLPATGTLSLTLNGRPTSLALAPPELPRYSIGPTALWNELAGGVKPPLPVSASLKRKVRRKAGDARRTARKYNAKYGGLERSLSKSPHAVLRYRKAWLLVDRDSQAQDNAEHLYRYLRAEQPSVNAWFVLSRSSGDWDRLSAEGFRLLEHGSREHHLALFHCEHVISSQVDHYIVRPLPKRYGEPTWRYTFLQHGVTKDDLSRWLNAKSIDLMITATPDEHASIVADGTPYMLSDKEVKLTGFPRHDRLYHLAEAAAPDENRSVLVMPTWRQGLLLDRLTGGNDRGLRDDFWETNYAVQWRKVLESERLHRVAAEYGWQIVFVPHPNMAGYLESSPLAPHIRAHKFEDIDVQKVLVAGGVLVTDYSSLAFEMAYIERAVVYFQFDQEDFFNGLHAYSRGSWSYEDQGFGPVTMDADVAIDEIATRIKAGGVPDAVYAARMKATFPLRDGKCSQRTYEAVRDLTRPLTYDELYLRLEPAKALAGVPVEESEVKSGPRP